MKYLLVGAITFVVGLIVVVIGSNVLAPASPASLEVGIIFAVLYLCSIVCVATQLILEKLPSREK